MYISNLAKCKLLHKESHKYEGYRLTYLGYDFLAIHSLVKKGVINSVGRQIGVGKESDVFEVTASCHPFILSCALHVMVQSCTKHCKFTVRALAYWLAHGMLAHASSIPCASAASLFHHRS